MRGKPAVALNVVECGDLSPLSFSVTAASVKAFFETPRGSEIQSGDKSPHSEGLCVARLHGARSPAHRKPKMAAAGPIFWWMVNSLPIGEQRLLNQRSLPGQASMAG